MFPDQGTDVVRLAYLPVWLVGLSSDYLASYQLEWRTAYRAVERASWVSLSLVSITVPLFKYVQVRVFLASAECSRACRPSVTRQLKAGLIRARILAVVRAK